MLYSTTHGSVCKNDDYNSFQRMMVCLMGSQWMNMAEFLEMVGKSNQQIPSNDPFHQGSLWFQVLEVLHVSRNFQRLFDCFCSKFFHVRVMKLIQLLLFIFKDLGGDLTKQRRCYMLGSYGVLTNPSKTLWSALLGELSSIWWVRPNIDSFIINHLTSPL